MKPVFTGSRAQDAALCIGSAVLPAVSGESSDASREGVSLHRFAEIADDIGVDAALEELPEEHRARAAALDLSELPQGLAREVGMLLDLETGSARLLRPEEMANRYRDLRHGPMEVPMTADLVGVSDRAVYVGDLKFGRKAQTAARLNLQLACGALAAKAIYDRDEAVVELLHVPPGMNRPLRDPRLLAELSPFDLAEALASLRDLAHEIIHARAAYRQHGILPDVRVGSHCRLCHSYTACHGQVAFGQALVRTDGDELRVIGGITSVEQAAELQQRLELYDSFADHARKALWAFGSRQDVPLPGGRFYGARPWEVEKIDDGDKAFAKLKAEFGAEVAERACEMRTSKAAINKALSPIAKERKQPVGKFVDGFLDQLRADGVMKIRKSMVVKVRDNETEDKRPELALEAAR